MHTKSITVLYNNNNQLENGIPRKKSYLITKAAKYLEVNKMCLYEGKNIILPLHLKNT